MLRAYWREAPPVNELLAAFVGYKAPSETINDPGELARFLRAE